MLLAFGEAVDDADGLALGLALTPVLAVGLVLGFGFSVAGAAEGKVSCGASVSLLPVSAGVPSVSVAPLSVTSAVGTFDSSVPRTV